MLSYWASNHNPEMGTKPRALQCPVVRKKERKKNGLKCPKALWIHLFQTGLKGIHTCEIIRALPIAYLEKGASKLCWSRERAVQGFPQQTELQIHWYLWKILPSYPRIRGSQRKGAEAGSDKQKDMGSPAGCLCQRIWWLLRVCMDSRVEGTSSWRR